MASWNDRLRQYTDINDSIKLTVNPKSTSTPHLQQCHNFDQPNDIYVHQSFSGLGVKYKPKYDVIAFTLK
ncbi:MAG: hypothetical protein RPT25_06300 [Cycloclasticus sp.]